MIINENTVKSILDLINVLVSPMQEGTGKNIDDNLAINLESVSSSIIYKELKILLTGDWCLISTQTIRWKFVCTCIDLLKGLSYIFKQTHDIKVKLLSMSQKKTLNLCIELVISFGLLPYFIPEVGVFGESRCKNWKMLLSENITILEKHERLGYVTESLLQLYFNSMLNDFIIPKHLLDLLSALSQLCFVQLKKPIKKEKVSQVTPDTNQIPKRMSEIESFVITEDVWNRLQAEREKFKTYLNNLIASLYQPLLIQNIMLLQTNKKMPSWLRKSWCKILVDCLSAQNGVVSTIKAVCDADQTFLDHWSKLEYLANMFTSVYLTSPKTYTETIAPQILHMLRLERKGTYQDVFCRIASLSVKSLYEQDASFAHSYFLYNTMLLFQQPSSSYSEETISQCINDLYVCFALPGNEMWSLPCKILLPIIPILFYMYCEIKDGVSYLKQLLTSLLSRFLKEEFNTSLVFNSLMFNEGNSIPKVPDDIMVTHGPNGGIVFVDCKHQFCLEKSSFILLELIRSCDTNGSLTRLFFSHLLRQFQDQNTASETSEKAEKKLLLLGLLNMLINDSEIQNELLKEPKPIIEFVGDVLDKFATSISAEEDIVCICLVFLSLVLEDMKLSENKDWSWFKSIVTPLDKIKKDAVSDVIKMLAEEVYNLIKTKNLIGTVTNNTNLELVRINLAKNNKRTACEIALKDACDALLPVRAHALMELITLLKNGDTETMKKKEVIFCIFQENLKHEDTYLYLKAVEGLASMALISPESVLQLLCDEYCTVQHDNDVRLKLGETLIRVIKSLGDFIYLYKTPLLNTFLWGARDSNNLIRASSLSNLAEICQLLNCNLGSITAEILNCAKSIIENDPYAEPRRASILVITLLMKGLSTKMFQVLEDVILELYRKLKHLYYHDNDETVRLHAQICLEQIDINTKDFFTIKPSFTKQIFVFDPPPS